ncbi:fibronectin type III domain-containing protein [Butyrivibrio sp. AD3002]|uniref:fibronectin type III domain-containing protein n=1 Tax=Butyrivibrio sp. AD3002 TaxID=1280670 RepID=UPI0003B57308|nr:fibronectin type III domain-containing protein [Butyrivibrio sp. AD3002]
MKRVKVSTCIVMLCVFFCAFCMASFNVRAQGEFCFTEVTQNSISFDWTEAAESFLESYKKSGKSGSYDSFQIQVFEVAEDGRSMSLIKPYSVPGTTYNSTVEELKPATTYRVDIKFQIEGYSSSPSIWNVVSTRSDNSYTMKMIGHSDTTLYVDFSDAVKQMEEKVKKAGGSNLSVLSVTGSIVEQSGSESDALSAARNNTTKIGRNFTEKYTSKKYTGLRPDTAYAVSVMLTYDYKKADGNKSSYVDEFIEAGSLRTAPEGGYSDDVGDNTPGYSENNREDSSHTGKLVYTSGAGSSRKNAECSATSDENSITLDWTKNNVIPSADRHLIEIGCVEESNYDAQEDWAKFGSDHNEGPYMRQALQKAYQGDIKVDKGAKSYKITGLKPGTQYNIVMRCGWQTQGGRCDTCYVTYKIKTKGDSGKVAAVKDISANKQPGYMYDCYAKRENGTIVLDWTEGSKAFISQSVFEKYFGKMQRSGIITVKYTEVPQSDNSKDIEHAYSKLENSNSGVYSESADLPCTKMRVFGIDNSKKYVFAIGYRYQYFEDGKLQSGIEYFYADETGTNYLKKKATDQIDGNQENSEAGAGGKVTENGMNNENTAAETTDKKQPTVDTTDSGKTTDVETEKSTDTKADEEPESKIKASKDTFKVSALKKKNQKVTLKVAPELKGKITVKNVSAKKLKKYADFKVKGRKVTVTMKKGAPKGVYKFKVTVAAYGKTKKTTETIKITVK